MIDPFIPFDPGWIFAAAIGLAFGLIFMAATRKSVPLSSDDDAFENTETRYRRSEQ